VEVCDVLWRGTGWIHSAAARQVRASVLGILSSSGENIATPITRHLLSVLAMHKEREFQIHKVPLYDQQYPMSWQG